jgi:hypothetical protein
VPGLTLAGLSLSGTSLLSQQYLRGSVSLTSVAPPSGAVVALSSSNSLAARVPSSVTVAGGAAEATFAVEGTTVAVTTPVTISASYNGLSRSASITVRPHTVTAAFRVASRSRGVGACQLGPSTGEADCELDGSSSIGPVEGWSWRYWTGTAPLGHMASEASSTMNLATRCSFFEGARGGEDANGNRYVHMEIELVVLDREGTRSVPVRKPVRMYPNRLCGFNY